MSIEVGEYIRTKDGYIAKITEIDHHIWFDSIINKISGISRYSLSEEEFSNLVIKHSKNIIDLIEVGDYVNGCLIVKIYEDPFIEGQINLWTNMLFPNKYYKEKITNKNIKTIVTKEQFNNMEYRLWVKKKRKQ